MRKQGPTKVFTKIEHNPRHYFRLHHQQQNSPKLENENAFGNFRMSSWSSKEEAASKQSTISKAVSSLRGTDELII